MTQLLSQLTPSHSTPPPATISHDPSTDTVMTAISRFDAPKPKRRAKAFALAILPLALALTACGGGSSDDSKTPPPAGSGGGSGGGGGGGTPGGGGGGGGTPGGGSGGGGGGTPVSGNYQNPGTGTSPGSGTGGTSSPYGEYAVDFEVLMDLANNKIPIYEILSNGWSLNNWRNLPALMRLAQVRMNTETANNTNLKTFDKKQLEDYKEFISSVEELAEAQYKTEIDTGSLKDLRPISALPRSADLNGGVTISADHSSNRSGNGGVAEALIDAIDLKYGTDIFGGIDLTKASTLATKPVDPMSISNLIGWGSNPSAQLSFFHASPTTGSGANHSVGMDLLHMEDVSLFLYYYANTGTKIKNTPSLSRSDFMDSLKEHGKKGLNTGTNAGDWTIGAYVDGNDPTSTAGGGAEFVTLNEAAVPANATNLTYNGLMLAGTIKQSPDALNTTTGLYTYMGDAEVLLKIDGGPVTAPATKLNGIDITFSNINLTDYYLNGMPGIGMIKFELRGAEITDYATFDESASGTNTNDIQGRFFGDRETTITKANNYGGRNAVGGAFKSRLTDEDGVETGTKTFYGVFGAVAD